MSTGAVTKIQHRHRDIDGWLVAISIIIVAVGTILIVDDRFMFTGVEKAGLETAAKITRTLKDVRRRLPEELSWVSIGKEEIIYYGDGIFTGPRSGADVVFEKGNRVSLDPETIIVVDKEDRERLVEVKSGQVSVFLVRGDTLLMRVGGEKLRLSGDGTEIQLSRDDEGGAKLSIEKGTLEVTTVRGSKVLKENDLADVTKNGQVTLKGHTVQLVSPPQGAVLKEEPVHFKWKADPTFTAYRLEIAEDRFFRKILHRQMITGAKDATSAGTTVEGISTTGPLYWKVKGQSEDGETSSKERQFVFQPMNPPIPLLPLAGENIFLQQNEGKRKFVAEVSLEWQFEENVTKRYHVQLASDSEFKKLLVDKELDEALIQTPRIPHGTYYWRVRSFDEEGSQSAWSTARVFNLVDKPLGEKLVAPRIPTSLEYLITPEKSSFFK